MKHDLYYYALILTIATFRCMLTTESEAAYSTHFIQITSHTKLLFVTHARMAAVSFSIDSIGKVCYN